uniref:Bacteriophage lambda head decoration protein D n=1 Tax=Candidatus Kentrum eta TaxID=2126337 RepID=A0A450UG71_9GAMM|nr:MAG: Bacteriophage lambda head decoration protein D [Candidatus Kentron sp. H]VFJ92549.1 MAG: Bacteriophage lambda head decoration protein D [Candidatus Kentron sp. H]VFJ99407.1 MAG: Bacteriophage lambda head decoration protein D [Candidatus Kentron sp. H]
MRKSVRNGNGSQDPHAILAEDVDATDADKSAVIYLSGEFDRDALTFGEGHDADSVKALFRTYNIHIKKSV